jgi:hypothetical protein
VGKSTYIPSVYNEVGLSSKSMSTGPKKRRTPKPCGVTAKTRKADQTGHRFGPVTFSVGEKGEHLNESVCTHCNKPKFSVENLRCRGKK